LVSGRAVGLQAMLRLRVAKHSYGCLSNLFPSRSVCVMRGATGGLACLPPRTTQAAIPRGAVAGSVWGLQVLVTVVMSSHR